MRQYRHHRGGSYGVFDNGSLTIANSGSISGSQAGIFANNDANVTSNSGTITGGGYGIFAGNNASVTNTGTISATSTSGVAGIYAGNNFYVTNSGTISGPTGITDNNTGSVLTNSGTIIGTNGPAIDLSFATADTLNLLPGSHIVGEILLGDNDIVNIQTGRGFSSILTFGCGCGSEGITDTASTVNFSGGAPYAISGNEIALIDPTAFGLADRTLMAFTGGIQSLIVDRLEDGASGTAFSAAVEPLAVASDAGGPSLLAGPDGATALWAKAFGGGLSQPASGNALGASGGFGGAAAGIDRLVTPDLRLGVLAGGGAGGIDVDLGAQNIKTAYGFVGAYGRYEWSGKRLDFSLTGGYARNDSNRLVADNLAASGYDDATASYGNWFLSPGLALSKPMPADALFPGATLIPAARLRYLAGWFDGYGESGSTGDLTVGSRTVQDLEGKLEVAAADAVPLPSAWPVRTRLTLGVLDLARLGSTAIDATVIGQGVQFAAPGKTNAVGVYGGVGADYRLSDRLTAFAAADLTLMNDSGFAGTGRIGLRAKF